MHWNKKRSLRREVTLDANADISLSLIEPLTGRAEASLPLTLSARATFSHYSVTPARGLHFGSVTYGAAAAPRAFEVANLGEFPFTVRLFPLGDAPKPPPPPEAPPPAAGKGGKGGAGGAKHATLAKADTLKGGAADGAAAGAPPPEAAAPNALALGQFTFAPAEAVVQPGCALEVAVAFRAEGAALHSAAAGIAVSERDFADHPGGLPYEVAGESCVPGAATRGARGAVRVCCAAGAATKATSSTC